MPRTAAAEHELARLQATAVALASVLTRDETARAVLEQCLGTLGSESGAVYLVEHDELVPIEQRAGARGPYLRFPLADAVPTAHTARTGEHLFLESREAIVSRFPDAEARLPPVIQASALLALVVKEQPIGVIALVFTQPRPFLPDERSFAGAIAAQCALALDRAMLLARERYVAEQTTFLADASEAMAASLEPNAVLRELVRLVVPRFADWCAVELVDGDETTHLEVAHVDSEKVRWAAEMRAKYPPNRAQPNGLYEVIRTGKPELYATIPEGAVEAAAVDAEHLAMIRALQMRSVIIVPLTVRGRTLGGLTAVWAESGNIYDNDDVLLFREVARRAAISVDNAILFHDQQQAVTVRDEFLSAAGHELKTPLSAMLMQVESLQRSLARGEVPSNLTQRLEKTWRAGARLEKLIDELLDVSRITAGRLRLDPEAIQLDEVVRDVADRFLEQAASAGCVLTIDAAPARGRWDRSRMDQVASNLIQNAIKYGRGTPIEVSLRSEGEIARLRVVDHGIGIAPAEQSRIFERFERVVENRSFGGFGLGLWIARQIVEASGGTITVESAPGKGATFEVRLPLKGTLEA